MRRVSVFVVAVMLSGCAEMQLAARDRFIAEYNCPRERVEHRPLGGNAYLTAGCGRRAVYVCEAATGLAAMSDPAVCRRER